MRIRKAYFQKALSFIDSELELLQLQTAHPEAFRKSALFSRRHPSFSSLNLLYLNIQISNLLHLFCFRLLLPFFRPGVLPFLLLHLVLPFLLHFPPLFP